MLYPARKKPLPPPCPNHMFYEYLGTNNVMARVPGEYSRILIVPWTWSQCGCLSDSKLPRKRCELCRFYCTSYVHHAYMQVGVRSVEVS